MIPRKRAYLQGSSMISVLDATVRWPCIINGDVISWISWIINCSSGNFSWATEAVARKVRVIDVVYNASNNELVRTKTLVKGCIVTIDSTPFRQWYESHYAKALGRKKNAKLSEEEEALFNGKSTTVLDISKPFFYSLFTFSFRTKICCRPKETRRSQKGSRSCCFIGWTILSRSSPCPNCLPTRSNRQMWRIHPWRQRTRLLRQKAQGQEVQIKIRINEFLSQRCFILPCRMRRSWGPIEMFCSV